MKPVPPTTCGSQYIPFDTGVEREGLMGGRAVKPEIQKMVAPMSWERVARKEVDRRWWDLSEERDRESVHDQRLRGGSLGDGELEIQVCLLAWWWVQLG